MGLQYNRLVQSKVCAARTCRVCAAYACSDESLGKQGVLCACHVCDDGRGDTDIARLCMAGAYGNV